MNIAVPREVHPGEVRVALIPEHVARLVKAGADVGIESGLGQPLRIADEKYTEAGASVIGNHNQLIQNADVVLRIRKPLAEEVERMKPGCVYISLLDPFNERELIDMFVTKNISAISMEMILQPDAFHLFRLQDHITAVLQTGCTRSPVIPYPGQSMSASSD